MCTRIQIKTNTLRFHLAGVHPQDNGLPGGYRRLGINGEAIQTDVRRIQIKTNTRSRMKVTDVFFNYHLSL